MIKFVLAALVLIPASAHAASVNDASFQLVIQKQVAREAAQRDMQEAIKVALAVRAEQKIARKKKVR